jgi:4-hydroxy 2-oxovalerate aldolase
VRTITISDPTLRDGQHAVGHRLMPHHIVGYCRDAEAAGVPIVEVGHGNGQGASSLQLGESALTDQGMLLLARGELKRSLLGIHIIPGFATIDRDLAPAIDQGVDVVRVASHVTEADLCERHIKFTKAANKTAYGVLMMSHMASIDVLVEEAKKLVDYGADAVIIMDSAGTYTPDDVYERIAHLRCHLITRVGFHAHNNLGLAVANSLSAIEAGASIIDGTARGFGAGAGNTPIELLVALLERKGYATGINLDRLFKAVEVFDKDVGAARTTPSPTSIVSGLAGVFSGFAKPVERAAKLYGVSQFDILRELGRRRVVAGQEDLIVEVAASLAAQNRLPSTG